MPLHCIALHCSVLYCIVLHFVDVSGLVSGLDSQSGSELPFVTTVDQIELRRSLWSRLWSRFWTKRRCYLRPSGSATDLPFGNDLSWLVPDPWPLVVLWSNFYLLPPPFSWGRLWQNFFFHVFGPPWRLMPRAFFFNRWKIHAHMAWIFHRFFNQNH